MRRTLFALLLWLSLPAWAQPNLPSTPDLPQMAEALREGQPEEALQLGLKLPASHGVFYNLGLAWRDLGDLPRARASFERALVLSPSDLATRRRLREVEGQLGEKATSLDVRPTPWWSQSQAELLLVFPGLALVVLGLAARRKKQDLPLGPALGIGLSWVALAGLVFATAPPPLRAVVVDSGAHLLPAPGPENPGQLLPAGVRVEVLEKGDLFAQIALRDGTTGWLRHPQLEELSIPNSP